MPGERAIDSIDDQIKPRADPIALPKPYHPAKGSRTRPSLSILRKQILTLYPSNQELFYPGLYHPAPLLSIPGKQISTLYPSNQELLYPGLYHQTQGSGTRKISTLYLRLYYPSRGSKLCIAWTIKSVTKALLSISGEQILMLHPRLYHPSQGSRSHIAWTIKPIIKTRVIHLLQPTSSTTRPNPRTPHNNAQKSHFVTMSTAIHSFSLPIWRQILSKHLRHKSYMSSQS